MILFASSAYAHNPERRQCLKRAQDRFLVCRDSCIDVRVGDKLLCGVNPDCHKACEANFQACRDPFENVLGTCLRGCAAAMEGGRDTCKAQVGCQGNCLRNAAFLACLRPFGVANYNCRQDCLEGHRLNTGTQAALKACRVTRNSCHKACRVPAAALVP
jgi:hypothetical protein